MKKALLAIALIASPALAVDRGDCRQLATLYEIRSLMMKRYTSSYDVDKVIDRRLDELREPLTNGGYRWVRWVRRESDAPVDKKVHKLNGSSTPDRFESAADHVFAVSVVVPSKRSLFNGNHSVSVGGVEIRTTVNGRTRTRTERIDEVMNPDTSRTFDLETIADHVEVAGRGPGRSGQSRVFHDSGAAAHPQLNRSERNRLRDRRRGAHSDSGR
jgi:hypothetical protein